MNSEKNISENKPKEKKGKRKGIFYNLMYDFVKVTGAIPVLIWLRTKVAYPFGRVKIPKAVLISANHRSLVDPVIVHAAFPWRRLNCLATKALYNTPLKAWFFNKMHCIEVDKENFSMASFHKVVDVLGEGRAVVIFPEGRLNDSADSRSVLTFKSGVVLMAHKGKAPILPVYIEPRTKWYKRQRVAIGLPIDVSELLGRMPSIEELSEVSNRVRECELQLMAYLSGEAVGGSAAIPDESEVAESGKKDNAVEV